MEDKTNAMLFSLLHSYKQDLTLRRLIIAAIGKVGPADEIRAATNKKYSEEINELNQILTSWDGLDENSKVENYNKIVKNLYYKLLTELHALKFLEDLKQNKLDDNLPTILIERAIKAHVCLIYSTYGLIAFTTMIHDNIKDAGILERVQANLDEIDTELPELMQWLNTRTAINTQALNMRPKL